MVVEASPGNLVEPERPGFGIHEETRAGPATKHAVRGKA